MEKLALLTFTLLALIGCKNDNKKENRAVTTEENKVAETKPSPTLETGCYEYKNDGNNIKMEITEVNKKVIGNLNISYAEKDANHGKFIGTINGDKLIGVYTFSSEGKESSREMAFLVKDKQLIEGYGELTENGTEFKDTNSLSYTSTMPLKKVDCD